MLAKSSLSWIVVPLMLAFVFLYTGVIYYSGFCIASILFFILSFFLLWFFRDPKRTPEKQEGIVSPADGTILPSRGDNKIRIFMSPLDVHVNRSPVNGKIINKKYRKGGHKPSYSKDSDNNEQLRWLINSELGEIEVTQIAGTLVRRIVSYKKIGDAVQRGKRIGMIRFGSRVDVTIPKGYTVSVKEGEQVYAGKTILAHKA